jgi:hypothetical protein
MATRRRSRRKSISGNLTDIQKRIRYLETRPAAGRLASKAVATRNLALRAVDADIVADDAVTRRAMGPAAVVSANLSVVGDPDGAAVATSNIQLEAVDTPQVADDAITNDKLAGDISDDKIVGVSASKIGPDLLQDDQLAGISTEKFIGEVTNEQLAGLITSDKIDSVDAATITVGQIFDTQIGSVDASTITVGLIQDEQIDGISGEKIIGGVDGGLIVNGSIEAIKIAGVDTTVLIGLVQDNQIEELSGGKIINGLDGDIIDIGSIQGSSNLGANSKIAFESIGSADIGENEIGYDQISGNSIDTVQIRENAVGSFELADLAVERRHLNDDVIVARMINNGAVETSGIQNLAVTSAKIANLTIVGGKIAESTITSNKIFGGTNIITSVTDSAVGLTAATSNGTYGQTVNITTNVGTGSTQLALGNHNHSGGSTDVPGHTHPFTITQDGSNTTGGASAGTSHTHNYGRAVGGTVGTNSTIRVKKEVSEYNPIDINKLLNLKLMKYKYKNEYRHLHPNREWMYGYMAEDLIENDFEEVIGYDREGLPDTVNYGLISIFVLELVKKHQNEIDSLKEEIQRLKEAK